MEVYNPYTVYSEYDSILLSSQLQSHFQLNDACSDILHQLNVYSHMSKISDQSSFINCTQQMQIFTHAYDVPYNWQCSLLEPVLRRNQVRKVL